MKGWFIIYRRRAMGNTQKKLSVDGKEAEKLHKTVCIQYFGTSYLTYSINIMNI